MRRKQRLMSTMRYVYGGPVGVEVHLPVGVEVYCTYSGCLMGRWV